MMKRMKKAAAVFMAITMAAAVFTGCGNSSSGGQTSETQQAKETANPEDTKKETAKTEDEKAEDTKAEEAVETKAEAGNTARKVGVVIKIAGNPFYEATDIGFAEAGEELGIKFITNGPSEATVEGQIQIIEGFISQKVDAIAIATNDFDAVVPALEKAKKAGIKVISWDSAVNPSGRLVHVNQAIASEIGASEIKGIAKTIGNSGEIAIVSAGATMVNQNAWVDAMKEELKKEEYKDIKLVDVVYGDDESQKSYNEALGLLKTYPDLKGIISPTTVGIAAVCKAVEDQKMTGKVYVTGIGLPSLQAEYIKNGTCDTAYIWNPIDLGYLSAYTTKALLDGEITGALGDKFSAGRLGDFEVTDDGAGGTEVVLGPPLELNKDNIDQYKEIF